VHFIFNLFSEIVLGNVMKQYKVLSFNSTVLLEWNY